jgi:hypothetical protein
MRHAVEIAPRQDLGDAVNMAAHHVPAEFVADLQRRLEVDASPLPPLPQRRHRDRLGTDVERDRRAVSARFDTNDGETHAGIGDRRPMGIAPAS